jgi:hypothetical protein
MRVGDLLPSRTEHGDRIRWFLGRRPWEHGSKKPISDEYPPAQPIRLRVVVRASERSDRVRRRKRERRWANWPRRLGPVVHHDRASVTQRSTLPRSSPPQGNHGPFEPPRADSRRRRRGRERVRPAHAVSGRAPRTSCGPARRLGAGELPSSLRGDTSAIAEGTPHPRWSHDPSAI